MPTVEFQNVSKKYRLGAPLGSLRDFFPYVISSISGGIIKNKNHGEYYWALRDVNFQINEGEAFGIIGPNGAGKTTTLKMLCKITKPTSGIIKTRGRIAALIELGAGFHPDLTGRENVYLYGAIMGLTRREIDTKFDEIVAFAELENFIDTPLKRYSSGMQVRLAFSVVAHIDFDILLVDEVLAVGDMAFRKKCQERMKQFRDNGKTIVFVSHNIYAIQALCNRTLYLKKGQVQAIGTSKKVVQQYINETNKAMLDVNTNQKTDRWGTSEVRIQNVKLFRQDGQSSNEFRTGDSIRIIMEYFAKKPIHKPHFQFIISAAGGVQICVASSAHIGLIPNWIEGQGRIICDFNSLPLLPNSYSVTANIATLDRRVDYDIFQDAVGFTILNEESVEKSNELPIGNSALIYVPYEMNC